MRTYMTSQGDLWDYVSYKLYADEARMDVLIKSNPHLRHIVVFEKPTIINVSDLPLVNRLPVNLPPWKQG